MRGSRRRRWPPVEGAHSPEGLRHRLEASRALVEHTVALEGLLAALEAREVVGRPEARAALRITSTLMQLVSAMTVLGAGPGLTVRPPGGLPPEVTPLPPGALAEARLRAEGRWPLA